MWRWFGPKCPLDTAEKTWTEWRMRWLADQMGIDRLLHAPVILPTDQHFVLAANPDLKQLRLLLERLCGHMGVAADKVSVEILDDERMPGAAGLYQRRERSLISIARSQLAEPLGLLATLSHELAHEVLLGGGLLDASVADHEYVTDLLTVYLGAGILPANDTVRDASGYSGGWSYWSMSKKGYLPSRIYGYAFALFAFARGETNPAWMEHLRLDARVAFENGLRYLHKTGDSLFHPDVIHKKIAPLTPSRAIELLQSGSPTARLATLWDLGQLQSTDSELLTAVLSCLDSRDPHVVAGAARAVALFGPTAEPAIPRLLDLLWRGSNEIKMGLAEALGAIHSRPERVVPELRALLTEDNPQVVFAAAAALHPFGLQAAEALPLLLAALKKAIIEGESALIHCLSVTLQALCEDPQKQLRDHFTDPELLQVALDAL